MSHSTKNPSTSSKPERIVKKIYLEEPQLYAVEPHPDTNLIFHFIRLNPADEATQSLDRMLKGDSLSDDKVNNLWTNTIYIVYGKLNWVSKLEPKDIPGNKSKKSLASQILSLSMINTEYQEPITRIYLYKRFGNEKHIFIYKEQKNYSINAWLINVSYILD